MSPSPDDGGAPGARPPDKRPDEGRVFDAEVLGPEERENTGRRSQAGSGQAGGNAWGQGSASGARYYRVGGTFGNGGFGRVWTATGADGNTCLAPCVTFALFFVCLSQFGFLAGIGFAVFHLAGSIAGSIRSMRRLVEGRPVNPWGWRLGNWFVSFMLTAWLAGGFNG